MGGRVRDGTPAGRRWLIAVATCSLAACTGSSAGDEVLLSGTDLADGFRTLAGADVNCGNDLAATMLLVDEATGAVVWQRDVPHTLDSEIAVVDVAGRPVVVAGASASDANGTGGFALDLATGAPIWQRLDAASGRSHAVVEGVLMDVLWESPAVVRRAVSASDGRELWRVAAAEPFPFAGSQPDGLADGTVFVVASTLDAVIALDAGTGAERWRAPTGGPVGLRFSDDGLYTLSPVSLARIDPVSGAPMWTTPLDDPETVMETFADDQVVVLTFRRDIATPSPFRTFDATTGSLLTAGTLPVDTINVAFDGERLVAAGRSYDGSGETSTATAFDVRTGSPVWTRPSLSVSRIAATAFGFAFVRFTSATPTVIELVGADGVTRWEWTSPAGLVALGVTVIENALLVNLTDNGSGVSAPRGGVVALDPASGAPVWEVLTDLPVDRSPLRTRAGLVVDSREGIISCD